MEVVYRLTEDEFVRAQQDYWLRIRKRYWQRAVDVVALFLIVVGIFGVLTPSLHPHWRAGVLLGFFGLWMFGSRRIWWPYFLRRTFRRSPNSQAEHRLAVDDEGIRITLPQSMEEVRWAAFQKAYETENAFLLLYSPTSFYIVPKRAFAANALGDFHSILQQRGLISSNLPGSGL